ncbi:MAG: TIGR00725 family protein [Acidobacteriota bacterium]
MTVVRPIVAVVGGSECTSAEAGLAEELGRRLAQGGAVVVCGGLTGVMEAVAKGVRASGGLTVGILPGNDARDANRFIDVPLATGMGEMRNALIVRVAGAIVAIGGGTGTLSEIALALRIGTPVVGLHDNFAAVTELPRVSDAAAAAAWALAEASNKAAMKRL